MSLSAHQARREHVLAVSRDFNSQPRLSKYQIFRDYLCEKKFLLPLPCENVILDNLCCCQLLSVFELIAICPF